MSALFAFLSYAEENPIWLGCESDSDSLTIPYCENGREINIEKSNSSRILFKEIKAISIWPRGRTGANIQLKLTTEAWKKLFSISKKLRQIDKKIALIINGKVVLLVSPVFLDETVYEDGMGLSAGPIPDKILQELKSMKNIDWYIPFKTSNNEYKK